MTKRGKILRDTSTGPGLVWVEQQQYPFSLGAQWRSATPPAAGMTVDVEFATEGGVAAVTPVSESQIAKEQAEAMMNTAREKGGAVVSSAIARFGLPLLIATALLVVGWFFLSAVSVEAMFGKISFTFWQMLGFLNSNNALEAVLQGQGGPSAGLYGFLAIIALLGPFVRFFWKDARAHLAGLLPLLFMMFVGIMVRSSLHSMTGGSVDGPLAEMQRQAQDEMMSAIKIGFGAYLSLLVSLYLAAIAAKQFLAARAANTLQPPQ
ncbi:MAG TPA: hypothetical protein VK574_07255 [Terracidiphilus sp.]|nr:hypothetical protein [Terracidiphilus sp.]